MPDAQSRVPVPAPGRPGLSILMIGPTTDEPGGITGVVDTLLEAGLRDCAQVRYIGLCPFGGRFSRIHKFRRYVWNAARAVVRIVTDRPDVLHLHVSSGASLWRKVPLLLLARLLRVPVLLHVHSGRFFETGGLVWRPAVIGRVLAWANRVVLLSEVWCAEAREWAPRALVRVIHNPARIDLLSQNAGRRGEAPPIVLYLGRIIAAKGVYDLLDAVPSILEELPEVEFWIAGNGEVEEFRQACRDRNLEGKVHFLGWLDEDRKQQVLREVTLLAQPSHYEGFGRSVVEAMAAGLPVVATTAGALPDIVSSSDHGLLVEPRNAAALARAILTLLGDVNARARMSQANRARAERLYAADRIVQQWSRLYRELSPGQR